MVSEAYVRGMIEGAQLVLKHAEWWQFIKKAKVKGFIRACNLVLEEMARDRKESKFWV